MSFMGSAITASAGHINALYSDYRNRKQWDKQADFTREMMEKSQDFNANQAQLNRDFQYQLFKENQEYNSASAQRQRLEEAGLNPYLMMSGGSAGSITSTPSGAQASSSAPSAPTGFPSQGLGLEGIGQAIGMYYQNKKTAADTANVEASTNQLNIENKYKGMQLFTDVLDKWANAKDKMEKAMYTRTLNMFLPYLQQEAVTSAQKQNQMLDLNIAEQTMQNAMTSVDLKNYPMQKRLELANYAADYINKIRSGELSAIQAQRDVFELGLRKDARQWLLDTIKNQSAPQNIYQLGKAATDAIGGFSFENLAGFKGINRAKSKNDTLYYNGSTRWR